jgi:hypothetical protein
MTMLDARRFSVAASMLLSAGLVLLAAAPARATAWTEAGDAGELPVTAQDTTGAGSVDSISGNLSWGGGATSGGEDISLDLGGGGGATSLTAPDDFIDMYQIHLDGDFRVSSTGAMGARLFLFDGEGRGIVSSAPTVLGGDPSLSGSVDSGAYYLAIAMASTPVSQALDGVSSEPIFSETGGPSTEAIHHWTLDTWSVNAATLSYTLTLEEGGGTSIPEPCLLGLAGLSVAGLARHRLRAR